MENSYVLFEFSSKHKNNYLLIWSWTSLMTGKKKGPHLSKLLHQLSIFSNQGRCSRHLLVLRCDCGGGSSICWRTENINQRSWHAWTANDGRWRSAERSPFLFSSFWFRRKRKLSGLRFEVRQEAPPPKLGYDVDWLARRKKWIW